MLATSTAAFGIAALAKSEAISGSASGSIRPFRVNVPEDQLIDLRRRLAATRWPTRELVGDRSQGVQLATLRELTRYWTTEYDWRKCEARLNALPQFTTEIDGGEYPLHPRQVPT
jgi:hypothetical protein